MQVVSTSWNRSRASRAAARAAFPCAPIPCTVTSVAIARAVPSTVDAAVITRSRRPRWWTSPAEAAEGAEGAESSGWSWASACRRRSRTGRRRRGGLAGGRRRCARRGCRGCPGRGRGSRRRRCGAGGRRSERRPAAPGGCRGVRGARVRPGRPRRPRRRRRWSGGRLRARLQRLQLLLRRSDRCVELPDACLLAGYLRSDRSCLRRLSRVRRRRRLDRVGERQAGRPEGGRRHHHSGNRGRPTPLLGLRCRVSRRSHRCHPLHAAWSSS